MQLQKTSPLLMAFRRKIQVKPYLWFCIRKPFIFDFKFPKIDGLIFIKMLSLDCDWTEWSGWSDCSITCGFKPGLRSRSRSQTGSQFCQKSEVGTKPCHKNKCARNCAWASWSSWSRCSQTCGTGTRSRSREVAIEAEFGGAACRSKDSQEIESCLENECPVNGEWSEWSRWGYCGAICGKGEKTRTRFCDNPKPEFGGYDCPGSSEETSGCEAARPCEPVNGGWTSWTRWTTCSKKCGRGTITRRRSCENPRPQNGGQECIGQKDQSRPCYLRKCSEEESPKRLALQKTRLTTENPTTIAIENASPYSSSSNKNSGCPHILGLLGPFSRSNSTSNSSLYYVCPRGRVFDPLINRRHFVLDCASLDFAFAHDLAEVTKWPRCVPATHCIGPSVLRI